MPFAIINLADQVDKSESLHNPSNHWRVMFWILHIAFYFFAFFHYYIKFYKMN